MMLRVWEVGKSESRAVMAWIRVSMLPDAKACPRPTGLSSQENLENRLQEEIANDLIEYDGCFLR